MNDEVHFIRTSVIPDCTSLLAAVFSESVPEDTNGDLRERGFFGVGEGGMRRMEETVRS